jgi:hypothetical protein
MKPTKPTKKKLMILSILATLTYCLVVSSSFIEGWDDLKLGFREGFESRHKGSEKKAVYFVSLKAKQGYYSFPDSITNLETNEKISIRYENSKVKADFYPARGKSVFVYELIETMISFLLFFIVIYIPLLFFKLMNSLYHEVVFDNKNIKLLRKMGILLVAYYVFSFAFNHLYYLTNTTMFTFKNYAIQRESTDTIWILLGIVVLLFAEILSKGSKIQEEQDLTI